MYERVREPLRTGAFILTFCALAIVLYYLIVHTEVFGPGGRMIDCGSVIEPAKNLPYPGACTGAASDTPAWLAIGFGLMALFIGAGIALTVIKPKRSLRGAAYTRGGNGGSAPGSRRAALGRVPEAPRVNRGSP